jgi:hypothetical protein
MKLRTSQWVLVGGLLTILWIGLMAWLSYKYLLEKDPVPIEQWTPEHRPR